MGGRFFVFFNGALLGVRCTMDAFSRLDGERVHDPQMLPPPGVQIANRSQHLSGRHAAAGLVCVTIVGCFC